MNEEIGHVEMHLLQFDEQNGNFFSNLAIGIINHIYNAYEHCNDAMKHLT